MREEIPEYVDELPVVSATPETVRDVLARACRQPGEAAGDRAPQPRVRGQVALGRGRGARASTRSIVACSTDARQRRLPLTDVEGTTRIAHASADDRSRARLFEWINDRELVLFNAPVQTGARSGPPGLVRLGPASRRTWSIFGIRLADSDSLIGSCQLTEVDQLHRSASLQVRIGEADERGHGYGREAVESAASPRVRRPGAAPRPAPGLSVERGRPCAPTRRSASRARECCARAAYIDGEPVDVVVMGILREEFGGGFR